MTDEKILEVLDRYEWEVPDAIANAETKGDLEEIAALEHLMEMFPQMREFVRDNRREKLMRWLGWVQGVLFMCNVYSLEEMKLHNMPTEDWN